MTAVSRARLWLEEYSAASYLLPFATELFFLALFSKSPLDPQFEWPLRVLTGALVCFLCWPRDLSPVPSESLASIAVGAGAFLIWIAPDLLFPGDRNLPLFSNAIVGHPGSSLPPAAIHSVWVLGWRTARAVVVVPIAEELFWRGWLLRWLIKTDFQKVPLGAYAPFAFWVTAALFGSEHGPYWDVGFLTGIIYNLWMIRSRSMANCILMHAVTNGLLSAYVIGWGQWQYWQ